MYLDFEEYGIEQTIGAVKANLARLGATARQETVVDRAERLAKDDEFRKKRKQLLNSPDGVEEAKRLLNALFQEIQKQFAEAQSSFGNHKLFCIRDRDCLVMCFKEQHTTVSVSVRWEHVWNSLEKSCLEVQEVNGLVPTSQETAISHFEKPRRLKKHVFEVDYTRACEWCWKEKHRGGERSYSNKALAEHILKLFLGLMDQVSKGELR